MSDTRHAPRRIEWAGPERWTVWADEDGVHVRTAGGDCLEGSDMARLVEVWQAATAEFNTGRVRVPRPLTSEELAADRFERRDAVARKRAVRAITAEFNDQPF